MLSHQIGSGKNGKVFVNKYSFVLVALSYSPVSFAVPTAFELPDDIQFTGNVVSPAPTWKSIK